MERGGKFEEGLYQLIQLEFKNFAEKKVLSRFLSMTSILYFVEFY